MPLCKFCNFCRDSARIVLYFGHEKFTARYTAFADLWRGWFCSHSWYLSSCLGWTTATQRSPDCRTINSVGFNRRWTLLSGSFSSEKLRGRQSAASRPTLAASAAANWVQAGGAHVRCVHSTAMLYLTDELHRVADIDTRRRLRLAPTSTLVVLPMWHFNIGDCTLSIATSRVWNSLPSSITSSTSLTVFRRRLKSELFSRCFGPVCVWQFCSALLILCINLDLICVLIVVKWSGSPSILWQFIIIKIRNRQKSHTLHSRSAGF